MLILQFIAMFLFLVVAINSPRNNFKIVQSNVVFERNVKKYSFAESDWFMAVFLPQKEMDFFARGP